MLARTFIFLQETCKKIAGLLEILQKMPGFRTFLLFGNSSFEKLYRGIFYYLTQSINYEWDIVFVKLLNIEIQMLDSCCWVQMLLQLKSTTSPHVVAKNDSCKNKQYSFFLKSINVFFGKPNFEVNCILSEQFTETSWV